MRAKSTGLIALLVVAGVALAADKEITGKVVNVDLVKKTLLVKTDNRDRELPFGNTTRLLDAKGGECKDGLKDKRLSPGTEVKLVMTVTGKTVREVHLIGAAPLIDVKAQAGKNDTAGTQARVLKVDVEKRTALMETKDGGKLELSLGNDVKFIGPKGGVSREGIRDDRFKEGAEVRIVMDGKNVKEVHLPLRGK